MKKIHLIIVAWWVTTLLSAQSYNKLWKAVDTALYTDKPRTAISLLDSISRKAVRENNNSWLLRSLLVRYTCVDNISPDSGAVDLLQLEEICRETPNDTVRALWHSALAQIYTSKAYRDTTERRKAHCHQQEALVDLRCLAQAHTSDFAPLFIHGPESRYYAHDLLSVVALPALNFYERYDTTLMWTLLQQLQSYYRKAEQRSAALLVTLDSIDRAQRLSPTFSSMRALKRLQQLTDEHAQDEANIANYLRIAALPSRGEKEIDSAKYILIEQARKRYGKRGHAATFENFLREMQQRTASLHGLSSQIIPGTSLNLRFDTRNVKKAQLHITPLHIDAAQLHAAQQRDDYNDWLQRQRKGKRLQYTLQLRDAAPYSTQTDSITAKLDNPGIYLVQLMADGKSLDQTVVACSDVQAICTTLPDSLTRVQIVDARSGMPQVGQIAIYNRNGQRIKTVQTNDKGIAFVNTQHYRHLWLFATTATDAYSQPLHLFRNTHRHEKGTKQHLQLFTDRGIYQPGQTIFCGGLLYAQTGDALEVTQQADLLLTLRNAQGKAIDTTRVTTDEMGHFEARFRLPTACLPGTFHVNAKGGGVNRSLSLRVEEYRRPSFYIETSSPSADTLKGDTALLTGQLSTYTHLPIELARIVWRITAHHYLRTTHETTVVARGETYSNADGNFYIPIRLKTPDEKGRQRNIADYYRIELDATAPNGETQSTTHWLQTSAGNFGITVAWPKWVVKEQATTATITLNNHFGNIDKAEGEYALWHFSSPTDSLRVATYTFQSGIPFNLNRLSSHPSGRYKAWIAIKAPNSDMVQRAHTFHLYATTDKRPASPLTFAHFTTTNTTNGEKLLTIASSEEHVVLFYDLLTKDKVLESRTICFSDSILHFPLVYRESYGDGATLNLACVRNGKLYHHAENMEKPIPEKHLQLTWSTHRTHHTPGTPEEWKLQVRYADGTPAHAAIVARLYDSALDALYPAQRLFNGLSFPRHLFYPYTYTQQPYNTSLHGHVATKFLKEAPWQLTRWDEQLFAYNYGRQLIGYHRLGVTNARATLMKSAAPNDAMLETATETEGGGEEAIAVPSTDVVRKDFAETALFIPRLRTDSTGTVSLVFTLPQSLTTWQFDAMAHTDNMHYALLDTTIVARKQWMISAAMPRFLRATDQTYIPVTLHNLTSETQRAEVCIEWRDVHTNQFIYKEKQEIELAASGTSYLSFAFETPRHSALLKAIITANAPHFSDGEEHLVAVMSNETEVVRTLPFTLSDTAQHRLRIDTLWQANNAHHRRLTIETSSHPTWYAVAALPALTQSERADAVSVATEYYALTMATHIASTYPEISQRAGQLSRDAQATSALLQAETANELPWYRAEQAERQQLQRLAELFDGETTAARRYSAIDRLKALQQADGAWSWFKGMNGNEHITLEVALLLARLPQDTNDETTRTMLQRAMQWLHTKQTLHLKHEKAGAPLSSLQLQYLYLCTLLHDTEGQPAQQLLQRLQQTTSFHSLLDKAYATYILACNGTTDIAIAHAESLLEHTICSQQGARLFDSRRAPLSAKTYRIPTQVAAIEALQQCQATQPDAIEGLSEKIEQMRLWLLLSKRTQQWETTRATTDAIALLLAPSNAQISTIKPLSEHSSLSWCITNDKQHTLATSVNDSSLLLPAGRQRTTFLLDTPSSYTDSLVAQAKGRTHLTVQQSQAGLAWGQVAVAMQQPAKEVESFEAGIGVKRHFEVYRNEQWLALNDNETIYVGERIRRVLTLTADADYDFVEVRTERPACFEPRQPLSGYTWTEAGACYRAVDNAATTLYFEHMRKGTHTVTEEYVTDRAGYYHTGLDRATCVYAPEFTGNSQECTIQVKP